MVGEYSDIRLRRVLSSPFDPDIQQIEGEKMRFLPLATITLILE